MSPFPPICEQFMTNENTPVTQLDTPVELTEDHFEEEYETNGTYFVSQS